MSRRRSVSLEPENVGIASPRRSTRLASLRCDSPIIPKTQLDDKKSTPLKRTRRSMSSQDLYESDINEKETKAIPSRASTRRLSKDAQDKKDDSPEITDRRRITRASSKSPTLLKTGSTRTPVKKRITISEKINEIEKPLDIISETDEILTKNDESVYETNNNKNTTANTIKNSKEPNANVHNEKKNEMQDIPRKTIESSKKLQKTSTEQSSIGDKSKEIIEEDKLNESISEKPGPTISNKVIEVSEPTVEEDTLEKNNLDGTSQEILSEETTKEAASEEITKGNIPKEGHTSKENEPEEIIKTNEVDIVQETESKVTIIENLSEISVKVNDSVIIIKEYEPKSGETLKEDTKENYLKEIKKIESEDSESEQIILELSEDESPTVINKTKETTNKLFNETTDLFEESKLIFEEVIQRKIEKSIDLTESLTENSAKEIEIVNESIKLTETKQVVEEIQDEDEIEIIEDTKSTEKETPKHKKIIKTKHLMEPTKEAVHKNSTNNIDTINITDDEETQINLDDSADVIECTQEENISIRAKKAKVETKKIDEITTEDVVVVSSDTEILKESNYAKKCKSLNKQRKEKELDKSIEKENIENVIQIDSDFNLNSGDVEIIQSNQEDNNTSQNEETKTNLDDTIELVDKSVEFIADTSVTTVEHELKSSQEKMREPTTKIDKIKNACEKTEDSIENKKNNTGERSKDGEEKETENIVEEIDSLLESIEENSVKSNKSEESSEDKSFVVNLDKSSKQSDKEEDETNISIVGSTSPDPNDKFNAQSELKIDIAEVKEQEYNLSLVNDDGLSYSPIGKAADVSPPIIENKTPKSESRKNKTPKKNKLNEELLSKTKSPSYTEKISNKKEKLRTSEIMKNLVDSESEEEEVNTSLKKRKRLSKEVYVSDIESPIVKKKKKDEKPKINFSDESDEEIITKSKYEKSFNDSSDDETEEESDGGLSNEFIEDEAMEGDEDTPSEDSNQIIDEGESVGSTSSEYDSDEFDDGEMNDFIVDDDEVEDELLSGTEDFLESDKKKKETSCWLDKKKRRTIIINDESSDEELDKMSMQPFGGFSPGGSLISVNLVSSVESDNESLIKRNEDLSKMIEDNIEIKDETKSRKTESDDEIIEMITEDDSDEVILSKTDKKIPQNISKSKANVEDLDEKTKKSPKIKRKSLNEIENVDKDKKELKNILSSFCDITNDSVGSNEKLNTSQNSEKLKKRKSLNKSADDSIEQKEENMKKLIVETNKNKRKSLDKSVTDAEDDKKNKRKSLNKSLEENVKGKQKLLNKSLNDSIEKDFQNIEKRKSIDNMCKSLDNNFVKEMRKSLDKIKKADESIDAELEEIASTVKDIGFDISDIQENEIENKDLSEENKDYNVSQDDSLNFVFIKPRKFKKRDSESMFTNKKEIEEDKEADVEEISTELPAKKSMKKKDKKKQRKDSQSEVYEENVEMLDEILNESLHSVSEEISTDIESSIKKSKKNKKKQRKESQSETTEKYVEDNDDVDFNKSINSVNESTDAESSAKKSKKKNKKKGNDDQIYINEEIADIKILNASLETSAKKNKKKDITENEELEIKSSLKKSKKRLSDETSNDNQTNETKKSKKQRLSFSEITEFITEPLDVFNVENVSETPMSEKKKRNRSRRSNENEWTVEANKNVSQTNDENKKSLVVNMDVKELLATNEKLESNKNVEESEDNKILENIEKSSKVNESKKKRKKSVSQVEDTQKSKKVNILPMDQEVVEYKKENKSDELKLKPIPGKILSIATEKVKKAKSSSNETSRKKKKTSVSQIEENEDSNVMESKKLKVGSNQENIDHKKGDKIHKTDILDKQEKSSVPDSALNFEIKKVKKIKPTLSEFSTTSVFHKPVLNRGYIKASGSGSINTGETKIEDISNMSKTIKRKEKKLKYSNLNIKLISASLSGQTKFSSFKEELLFGKNVKRINPQHLLKKNLYKLN